MSKTVSGPVRTYSVEVYGYTPVLFSARSPGKARAQAYRQFVSAWPSTTFHDFLVRSRVWRSPEHEGLNKRIVVCGKPATRVIGPRGVDSSGIYFMWDGSDEILTAHPTEVQELR